MNEEETRPTEGFLKCSPEVWAKILEELEIHRVAKKLIRSAAGVDTTPSGGRVDHEAE
jgi:hypothetical protein